MNVTLYCGNSVCSPGSPAIPVALWASVINEVSCFNDQPAALPCRQTTSTSRPAESIVWKISVPQGNIGSSLPVGAIVAHKHFTNFIDGDSPKQPIDNGTDVFTDMFYDTTNLNGNNDPSSPKRSVQTLHEVPVTASTTTGNGSVVSNSGCFFLTPLPNACIPNLPPNVKYPLIFSFTCTKLSSYSQFKGLEAGPPQLSLVETFQSQNQVGPVAAPLPATNGTVSFAPFPTKAFPLLYEVIVNGQTLVPNAANPAPGTQSYSACAQDPTGTVQTFCTTFTKQTDCDNDADDK